MTDLWLYGGDEMKVILMVIVDFTEALLHATFGEWDSAMTTLLIFMVMDYLACTVIKKLYKCDIKSKNIKCKTGWKGISKKCMLFVFIIAAHRIDLLISIQYIRNIVVVAFITNELLSLIESAKMMGIRVPQIFMTAIEILREKIGMTMEEIEAELETEIEKEGTK